MEELTGADWVPGTCQLHLAVRYRSLNDGSGCDQDMDRAGMMILGKLRVEVRNDPEATQEALC